MIESEALRAIGLAPGAREMPQNACSGKPEKQGFSEHASQDLFLETTDRSTVRAKVAARRIDAATVAEAQVAHAAVDVRRSRPIAAVAADIAETAIVAVATTRSRIPNG